MILDLNMFRSLLVPLLALVAIASGCSEPSAPPVPLTGSTTAAQARIAPDFTLTTLDGATKRLADFRGKVVFVNLWATWCPPCREELPTMVQFYQQFAGRGVEILAISEDTDPNAVRKMVQRHGIRFPVLLDENKRVYNLYRATGIPETHLVDKQGLVQASQIGPFDWTNPAVVAKVEELLSAP